MYVCMYVCMYTRVSSGVLASRFCLHVCAPIFSGMDMKSIVHDPLDQWT